MKKYMVETGWIEWNNRRGRKSVSENPNGDEQWYDTEAEARKVFERKDIKAQWQNEYAASNDKRRMCNRDAYAALELYNETEDDLELIERLDQSTYGYSDSTDTIDGGGDQQGGTRAAGMERDAFTAAG